jgi:hypothetical protein
VAGPAARVEQGRGSAQPWQIAVPTARYELKYLIPEAKAARIAGFLEPYCVPDPFLKGAPRYTITSLYLDTPALDLLWSKRTLQSVRMKARVRTYGILSDGPVFLELKRRFNDVMVKTRVEVPRERWAEVLEAGADSRFAEWAHKPSKAHVIQDFRVQCTSLDLSPKVLVRYERQPFVGRQDPGVRVTFDRGLRCLGQRDPVLHPHDRDYRFIDAPDVFEGRESLVILEMKFDGVYPLWMIDLVRRFDLLRESFSKYAVCMDKVRTELAEFTPGRRVPVTM